ncbi:hypothetical protein Pcac1_g8257 [Phytophthora cactorum]|uniref:Uncharacterized protein n=1 Tax=Phytophthora cactorum TaxID=29920 RepID=A0A8T1DFZ9_9STRA|nr:hypothetical protein Pcac1_g8257 [Phytophthora cactorum]KAG2900981.1 hypothetical protein PC114_g13366 [Phytophthora cactorum]KAG2939676.1 hypothetical protein PC117_g10854 [Phytophthora cactorum]KAG3010140.1 hypothetical protein PC119_g13645 [Phytophthora cactorum]KAG3024940.1 hypothetical protein PC120_g6776 [Phytophthora cactorum]
MEVLPGTNALLNSDLTVLLRTQGSRAVSDLRVELMAFAGALLTKSAVEGIHADHILGDILAVKSVSPSGTASCVFLHRTVGKIKTAEYAGITRCGR